MTIFDKKFKSNIKDVKSLIKQSQKYEEKQMNNLAKKMRIVIDSPEYLILWDYIYNDSDWTFKYSK